MLLSNQHGVSFWGEWVYGPLREMGIDEKRYKEDGSLGGDVGKMFLR